MLDSIWLYPLLFAASLVAGWIDSIAGGGGLITIPVLLGVGLPPAMVLGTNKFQASFGSFTAAYYYVGRGVVPLSDARPGIVWTLVGAAAGTWAVQQIDPAALNIVIPFLLLLIALYMYVTPSVGEEDGRARMQRNLFYVVFGVALGFYDGFFGPGVGSFWAIALVLVLGQSFARATAVTKVMNATSNVASLALFALGGHVHYGAGIAMALGQVLGGRIG